MLDRGREIVILKSSTKGKSHPSAGDRGYINNAFVFPKYGFILIDAFFFYYNKSKNNENRCERKKFILDVCMTAPVKKRFMERLSIEDLMEDNVIFNLNAIRYNCLLTNDFSIQTLFHQYKPSKIPYVELYVKDNPKDLSLCSTGELKSWFKTQLPLLEYRYDTHILNVNTISKVATRVYARMYSILWEKLSAGGMINELILKKDVTREDILENIYHIRQLQAAVKDYLMTTILNELDVNVNMQEVPLHSLLESPHAPKVKFLLITLLKPTNLQNDSFVLAKSKIKMGIPSSSDVAKMTNNMDAIKKDFRTNSEAALHRLVTENKYINSLFTRR